MVQGTDARTKLGGSQESVHRTPVRFAGMAGSSLHRGCGVLGRTIANADPRYVPRALGSFRQASAAPLAGGIFSGLSSYLASNGEDGSGAEKVTVAVFLFLQRKATYGEISDLQRVVPALLIDLWPAALRAA